MTPTELKQHREQLGLSQAQMAELLGYRGEHAKQQVSRMEKGQRSIGGAVQRVLQLHVALRDLIAAARRVIPYRADDAPVDAYAALEDSVAAADRLMITAPPPLWKAAFPDYDDDLGRPEYDLPGFVDNSWKNDACPCKWHEERGLVVWFDYMDERSRETSFLKRFALQWDSDHGGDMIVESDDWSEIRAKVDELLAEEPAQ